MNKSILVVDDEQSVLSMLRDLLVYKGYAVVEAESGEQALEVVSHTLVDLIVTDLKMPGITGLELARQLLAQDPDRPVLLMTAYGQLESAQKAIQIGVYEYFTKPLDLHDMMAGIERALKHRQLVLEVQDYQKNLEHEVEARTLQLRKQIQELKARDLLLKHLLSVENRAETLNVAVELALSLCDCDVGLLYIPDLNGAMQLRTTVGFSNVSELLRQEDLGSIAEVDETRRALKSVVRDLTHTLVQEPGDVRLRLGIHSYGMLPVCRDGDVIAVIEVGRMRQDALVSAEDLDELEEFASYIAMAVIDCQIQETLPSWREDVNEVLKTAEQWVKT